MSTGDWHLHPCKATLDEPCTCPPGFRAVQHDDALRRQYCIENASLARAKAPTSTPREGVLSEAVTLITGDRNQTYGSPTQNFTDTANVWNTILRRKLKDGESIEPGEVAAMMVGLKLVRMVAQPKRDNWVDIAGYAGCGYEADVDSGRIVD